MYPIQYIQNTHLYLNMYSNQKQKQKEKYPKYTKNVLLAGDTKNTAKSDLLAFISCTSLCRLHFGSFGPEIKQNWEKMTKSS